MGVLVFGAGGHAKVVLDTLDQSGHKIIGIIDENKAMWHTSFRAYPVLGGMEHLPEIVSNNKYQLFLAIGNNTTRKQLDEDLSSYTVNYALAAHPNTQIDTSVKIEEGTAVMAHVAINADTHIGKHVILNTGCTIDHDCIIEGYVHLSPGTHLAGNVHVGEGAHLGVGVSVIPGIKIGAWSVIGAGAAVVDHIPAYSTAVGVPARVIKTHEPD